MVSLLRKLWDSRNWGFDTLRAPSALRARTPAASRRRKTSCRPQLEELEDRLTPAIFMQFTPVAHVAVNPQPLPPSGLIEFDPLVNLSSATPGTSTQQEHIVGRLSKQITIPSTTAGTPGQMWNLDVFYKLTGTATGMFIPPSPTAAGSDSTTFRLAGTVDETLAPVAATTGATWVFHGTMTEQGSVNTAISAPDPATGMQNVSEEWQYSTVTLEKGIAPNSGFSSWLEQIQSGSIGNVAETMPPPSPAGVLPSLVTASFWQQDQVSACFMPVVPIGHPPNPCITIDATANTWGSVTMNVFCPPGPNTFPEVDVGTTQYTDSLTETILMPDGSMQTLSQTSVDTGSFVSIDIES